MDYINVDSEFIEYLNYLRPPVKRTSGPSNEAFNYGQRHEVYKSQLVTPSSSYECFSGPGIESSTSLIQNKCSHKNTNLNPTTSQGTLYSNQAKRDRFKAPYSKNTPIINVTVIPRSNKSNHNRKRRQTPKRIQSSLSNQENSVTSKLYLVIAKDEDKIYKIKATESATLTSDKVENISYKRCNKNDDISFEDLCNFKILMKSLNMDEIKKECHCNKSTCKVKMGLPSEQLYAQSVGPSNCQCRCARTSISDKNGGPTVKRYRLLGEFGVNDNDNPFLRHDPSNDEEDPRAGQALRCDLSSDVPGHAQRGYGYPSHPYPGFNEEPLRTETQSTQVNFNVRYCPAMVNQTTQCGCVEDKNVEIHLNDEQINNNDCDSPLIIVSVFRKPSPNECSERLKISVDDKIPTRLNDTQNKTEHKSRTKTKPKVNEKRSTASRSPAKKTSRNNIKDELIETRPMKQNIKRIDTKSSNTGNTRGRSPLPDTNNLKRMSKNSGIPSPANPSMGDRQQNININLGFKANRSFTPPSRCTNNRIPDCANCTENLRRRNEEYDSAYEEDFTNNNHNMKKRVQKASEYHKVHQTKNYNRNEETSNFDSEYKNQGTLTDNNNTQKRNGGSKKPNALQTLTNFVKHKKEPHNELPAKKTQDTGTNTEHARTKKAIVDDYTKRLTQPNSSKNCMLYPPNMINSKVAISIDGESEYYDVLFNQNMLNTDLNIRKTIKDTKNSKLEHNENTSISANKKLSPQPSKSLKSPKQSKLSPTRDSSTDHPPKQFSLLAIRDSLEIFHRRDGKSSSDSDSNIITQTPATQNDNEVTEVLAPTKHYTGDNCDIVDPIERDKEIRQLLGVPNVKVFEASTQKGFTSEQVTQNPERSKCNQNQLIFNRNVQVFLQVEQLYKHKPIMTLSRRHYEKVKRKIQATLYNKSSNERRKKYIKYKNQHSYVSIGEVRMKRPQYTAQLVNKHIQTVITPKITFSNISNNDSNLSNNNLSSISDQVNNRPNVADSHHTDKKKYGVDLKVQRMIETKPNKEEYNNKLVCSYIQFVNQNQQYSEQNLHYESRHSPKEVYITHTVDNPHKKHKEACHSLKHTMSSIQFHQESYTFRGITHSDAESNFEACVARATSFQTLFRGHRKTPTPNFGTSVFSIYSEELGSDSKAVQSVRETKIKKPFLRRLMSCFVMHSRISQSKHLHEDYNPSVASSIDSYHISTLGAAEISSSMYDTSVSFYSSHTVLPINTKIKRGFLSSVRGFISNRKS